MTSDQLNGASANSQDGARLDVSANGVVGFRRPTLEYFTPSPPVTETRHQQQCTGSSKKRAYQQRMQEVEHSSFIPLVLSATGGMGNEATILYKRLASLLSQKWDFPYSTTLRWLRCRLSYSLLHSSIQAIRGARSSQRHAVRSPTAIDLVTIESHITENN